MKRGIKNSPVFQYGKQPRKFPLQALAHRIQQGKQKEIDELFFLIVIYKLFQHSRIERWAGRIYFLKSA